MLIGGNFPPFRQPADGVPFYCAQYRHATGEDLRAKYVNTLTVPDGVDGGTSIPPYTRHAPLNWIGTNQTPVNIQYTIADGQPNTAPAQNFFATGDKINVALCRKSGFKNVCARRYWHGMFGFKSYDAGYLGNMCSQLTYDFLGNAPGSVASDPGQNPPGDPVDYIETYAYCYFATYQPAPDATKYLTVDFQCTTTGSITDVTTAVDGGGAGVTGYNPRVFETSGAGSLSMNVSVNPLSGEIVLNSWSLSNTYSATFTIDGVSAGGITPTDDRDFSSVTSRSLMSLNPFDYLSLPNAGTVSLGALLGPVEQVQQFLNQLKYNTLGHLVREYGGGFDIDGDPLSITSSLALSNTKLEFHYTQDGNLTFSGPVGGGTGTENVTSSYTVDLVIELSGENTSEAVIDDLNGTLLAAIPLNDDGLYPWRLDENCSVAPMVSRLEKPNTAPILIADNLVPDLSNALTDSFGVAPFAPGWNPTYGTRTWFDGGAYAWYYPPGETSSTAAASGLTKFYDGSIQGRMKPGGYEGYFRFDWERWAISGGAWLTSRDSGSGMPAYFPEPKNVTQVPTAFQCANKPIGAYMVYADQSTICDGISAADGALWSGKWAEIGEAFQSVNFARPAGADKFALDETQTVYCSDGTTLYQQDGTTPAASVTLTGPWGGASVSGFYNGATTNGSGTLSLGTKLFDAPSDWETPSHDGGTAFGKLRWSSAPALLGRVAIAPAADANGNQPFSHSTDPGQLPGGTPADWMPTYAMTPAQTTFGLAAAHTESVDIYDGAMGLLASATTATRLDDSRFTIAGVFPTASFVTIHGTDYKFCDNYPKGDYVYLTWLHDFRTNGQYANLTGFKDCGSDYSVDCGGTQVDRPALNNGFADFTQTQGALPLHACQPRVVCISPNGEQFPNGVTYGFPDFALDERYGSKWQGVVLFQMNDPFWQTPHAPCEFDGAWVMDNGLCNIDDVPFGTKYFALVPQVEARLSVPSGFPALPADVHLGFDTPVTYPPTGSSVAYPPPPCGCEESGAPAKCGESGIPVPWVLMPNLCGGIAGGECPFMGDYIQWVVGCPPATP